MGDVECSVFPPQTLKSCELFKQKQPKQQCLLFQAALFPQELQHVGDIWHLMTDNSST